MLRNMNKPILPFQIMCEKSKLYKRAITTILNCNQIKRELYVYFLQILF